MSFQIRRVLPAIVLAAAALPLFAQEPVMLRVGSWNLESGESDAAHLAEQLAAKERVDLWGLSEVDPDEFTTFLDGAADGEGGAWRVIEGTSGGNDRLAILYDGDMLELIRHEELAGIGMNRFRDPLTARFRGRRTGIEFLFMVNHLARGDAAARLEQARELNRWAPQQDVPVIAVGDFNFDYHVTLGDSGRRDAGFDELIDGGAFVWVRPLTLVKTQASPNFDTVLDFVFVANADLLPAWTGVSRILDREGDQLAIDRTFTDSDADTDHRPIDAIFAVVAIDDGEAQRPQEDTDPRPDPEGTQVTNAQIAETLNRLSDELARLRDEVRQLRERIDALENGR